MACKTCQATLNNVPSTNDTAARTHDISQVNAHIATTEWLRDLSDAIDAAWPRRHKRYSKAAVLMLSWRDGDISDTSTEFGRLHSVFENEFNYEVHRWQIPSTRSGFKLTERVQQFVGQYYEPDNLLIVYYAGHARRSDQVGAYPIWFARQDDPSSVETDTASISSLLTEGDVNAPDILTLYDCCHPLCTLHGASQSSNAVIESLCAGGFESEVPMPGPDSFTSALVEELSAAANSEYPVSVPELHKKLIRRLELFQSRARWNRDGSRQLSRDGNPAFTTDGRRTPVYVSLTAHRPIRTIMLPSLRRKIHDQSRLSNSDDRSGNAIQDRPTVLLVVRVAEDEVSAREEVRNWLLSSPPGVVEFRGFFQSYSTLLLVEIALEVWDLLPSRPAVTFAGFVNNIEPIALFPDDMPISMRSLDASNWMSKTLPYTMILDRLHKETDDIPPRNPQSDRESFAQLMSYANTISYKQLSEWKRLHLQHTTYTSLSTSLFVQFCELLLRNKSTSPDVKKCLLIHQPFISEYLCARELIEDKTTSLQILTRLQVKSLLAPESEANKPPSRMWLWSLFRPSGRFSQRSSELPRRTATRSVWNRSDTDLTVLKKRR